MIGPTLGHAARYFNEIIHETEGLVDEVEVVAASIQHLRLRMLDHRP